MKKWISMLLALCLLLSGCGGSAEPVQTTAAPTTAATTEAPTEAPTKPAAKELELGDVENIQYDEFTVELKTFMILYGDNNAVYQYRSGMSISDWACSELNTDGWIPWFDDMVLSPDRAYYCNTGYLSMEEYFNRNAAKLVAEEFDGSVTYYNNDNTTTEFAEGYEPQNAEQLEAYEIDEAGNISVPVAHMVNAKTPLFTPGFRIVSKADGLGGYHSVEMGYCLYLLDDILDIYMNGIPDELIPRIKLYAFPESQEFMEYLGDHTLLNAHPTPLEKDSEMLTIPEDAVCLSFSRVPDGQEAPNSPNPYRPGHENLNKDAVYARYVTREDPNFGPGVNLVFAITLDEEVVYWIHMGSRFRETLPDIQRYVYAMGY